MKFPTHGGRTGWYVLRIFRRHERWRAEATYGAGLNDPQPQYSYIDDGDTPEEAQAAVMKRAAADKDWPKIADEG